MHDARPLPVYTGSIDEKPGVEPLGTTAPDLPPVPSKYSGLDRDHEYVRHGLKIIDEMNPHPVRFQWNSFDVQMV